MIQGQAFREILNRSWPISMLFAYIQVEDAHDVSLSALFKKE
jgi:hypothetical protein